MKTVYKLGGIWKCCLDEKDLGVQENWQEQKLAGSDVRIPGTTAENKLGKALQPEIALNKENVRCLRENYKYLGAAWYQTTFEVKEPLEGKRGILFLERVMFGSTVWIDGVLVGKGDSLSAPHRFDITDQIRPGEKQLLTIRVDNRDIHEIGPYPSAYTDETQTIWNGITGAVELQLEDEVSIKGVVMQLHAEQRKLKLEFDLDGQVGEADHVKLILDGAVLEIKNLSEEKQKRHVQIETFLPEYILYWEEANPQLYDMAIELEKADGECTGRWERKTGFREFRAENREIRNNGKPVFLRGNIDCCVYPKTGHPPMDTDSWEKICAVTKEYGLNHIRFHSWCPPEAAFEAADKAGLYLQIEGPMWMDNWNGYQVGSRQDHYTYLVEEAKRIVEEYAYHPSFFIFSNGNELNGDFELLASIVREIKKIDPSLLCTLSTNWDREVREEDDIYIAQTVDGLGVRGQYFLDAMAGGTGFDYTDAVTARNIPVISHEVGQYVVYPNVEEIPKYTGVLRPVNLESIRKDLEEKKLLSYVPEYVKASGHLAAFLYKGELEAALRTEKLSGIQLLGLQDFPGQSTATIGLLDCFMESKGIMEAEEYRQFCNETVLLADHLKFCYRWDEPFSFGLDIAHYGNTELKNICVEMKLWENKTGKKIWSDVCRMETLKIGLNRNLYELNAKLFETISEKTDLTLSFEMEKDRQKFVNSWQITAYGPCRKVQFSNCYETLTEEAKEKLEQGENVILLVKPDKVREAGPGKFFPVFWSPVHFASKDPCGMIFQEKHPFFTDFYPSGKYAGADWKDILEHSFNLNLDEWEGFEPMTMAVPNFYNNHKYTNLLEANVSNGKLLLCSIDLETDVENSIERMSFLNALSRYYNSDSFCPTQCVEITDVEKLFVKESEKKELYKNIAEGKSAQADSEKSANYSALHGNDGNPMSGWMAADAENGHYWQVDLGQSCAIVGTKVSFHENVNILYVIHTSEDGKEWTLAVNQTGQTSTDRVRTDFFEAKARFVRITYNGLPDGIWAGHTEFEVLAEV